jgi:hypothetical protein
MNAIWQSTFGRIRSQRNIPSDDDALERGEATHEEDEKTPLLASATASDNSDSRTRWRPHLSIFKVLYATLLAPVYSILVFLPMLPFWIFAGFLVYLLGSATNNNFYLYCGVLTVVLPFNIVGTVAIVRRVWLDMYGG